MPMRIGEQCLHSIKRDHELEKVKNPKKYCRYSQLCDDEV